MKSLIFLFSLSFLFPVWTYSQDDVKFERLSLQEGVAHNLTYCMIKDHNGFLWLGTMYGLARYEGPDYTVFKHEPEDTTSISFDDIVSLLEDRNGNIWIGTWGGGLNKYDPYKGVFTRFIYQDNNRNNINDNIVWSLCEDKNGNIWIGTERGGLNMYNPQTKRFTHYKSDGSNSNSINSNTILSLFCDSKGHLWIGSKAGLSRFNYENNTFENYESNSDDQISISSGAVKVIYEDIDKNLWIGTVSGLNKFDGANSFKKYYLELSAKSLSSNFILSITEDSKGNLWVGTGNGLNRFDKKTEEFTRFFHNPNDPSTLSGNIIHNVIEDNSGIIWVNAYNSGINKTIKPSAANFQNFENLPNNPASLNHNNVLSITEGKNGLVWIGTMNGLNSMNPLDGNIRSLKVGNERRENVVSALATDIDANIWIGTYTGLKLFNPSSRSFYKPNYKGLSEAGLFSSRITALLVDSTTVWIGTYDNGLFMLDRKNNSLSRFSYEGKHFNNYQADYILTLYKDGSDIIWIGSFGGLMMYNKKNNTFTSYKNDLNYKMSLSNNYVFSIFRDSKKELWIGTSNGLNRLVPASINFEHYFEEDGLPNNVICAVTEDDNGNLWISTNRGLSKFNNEQKTFTNYDITDGPGGNLYNPSVCVKGEYGNLVFGGNWGLTLFYPGEMSFSDYNPSVLISSIKKIKNDSESTIITSFSDKVEIGSSEKTIIVKFSSLDFTNTVKNKYSYKLEGISNDWINTGNGNSVTFTNLEPGEYILKARGTNSDGILSSQIAELNIIVLPPFWQTWWFQLSLALLIILIIFLIIKSKARLKIRQAIEIQKIKEEEISKVRKQAAIDFHDELGHRLTRISLLAEMVRKKLHNTFSDIDPLLKKISENSHSLYEGTRDFIWSIDPEEDTLFDLMIRLKDFGDELFANTNIKFNLKGVDEHLRKYPLNMDWKRHVTLIFKEAMNNALKYSDCKNSTLEIEVEKEKKVEIFLFDDGKGFDPEGNYDGNGLKNMKKRADKIDGILDIDSRPIVGTKISFKGIIQYNYLDYSSKVA